MSKFQWAWSTSASRQLAKTWPNENTSSGWSRRKWSTITSCSPNLSCRCRTGSRPSKTWSSTWSRTNAESGSRWRPGTGRRPFNRRWQKTERDRQVRKISSILISVNCCKFQLFFVNFYWNFFHCKTTQVIREIKFHFVLFFIWLSNCHLHPLFGVPCFFLCFVL